MFASIFIAVILILIVFYIRKLLKIPKELKNIPYMPQLPFVWAMLRQKYHDEVQDVIRKSLKEGHDIHISRCGKTIFLNITSPEFVKDLLVEPVDVTPKLQFPPGEAVHKVFGNGLLFSNGDIWRAHRKLASSAFNSTLSPEMVGETTMEFFTFMQNNLNRPIDAYGIMQRLTLEIIGKLAFGYKFGYLESEDTPHIINVYKFIIDVAKSVILVSFPWISKLPTERNRKFHKLIKEFDSFIFNIIGMRRKEVNIDRDICYKDLLSTMLKLSEIDRVYYDTRSLRDEVVTFFIAGHDTTSMALAASLYHLAKCPEMQEKARAEVISVLGNELVIPNSAQLKKLKYINAIIKETLRMYPPVPATNLRELTKPIKVGPYVIPEKVLCTVNIWQVQRHPKFWDNPNQFDPERFMGNEKRHQFAWIPFAAGSRNCVGQNFALSEQRIILSMMLLKYNWTLPENSINKDKLLLNSSFLLKPIDLQLTFTERI